MSSETALTPIRSELKELDQRLSRKLQDFRSISTTPKAGFTVEQINNRKLSQDLIGMAISTNTPPQLFAGVSLFLAINIGNHTITSTHPPDRGTNKLDDFKEVCELLCERHNISRRVFETKQEDQRNGKAIKPFDLKQHNSVVVRMHKASTLGTTGDPVLSANIISWVAAVNAGWQDMGINGNTGPFISCVTENNQSYPIKDPRPEYSKAII